jgi:hypothetical protein
LSPALVPKGRLNFRPVQIRFENCLGSATTLSSSNRPFLATTLSFLSSRVLDGPGGPPKKMNMRPEPHVRRSVPGFPASLLSPATTDVVLSKENHTQLTEVATLDRKSGEGEGSAVRHSCAPLLRPTASANHHRTLMETPTPPCHSGFPGVVRGTADPSASLRDDKKERVIAGKGRLLDERAVT